MNLGATLVTTRKDATLTAKLMELLLRDRLAQRKVIALGSLMVSTGIIGPMQVTNGLLSKRLDQVASILLGGRLGTLQADCVLLCTASCVGVLT